MLIKSVINIIKRAVFFASMIYTFFNKKKTLNKSTTSNFYFKKNISYVI